MTHIVNIANKLENIALSINSAKFTPSTKTDILSILISNIDMFIRRMVL